MNCPHATRLLSDEQDRALDSGEQRTLEEHLAECPACVKFRRQLEVLRFFMQAWRERAPSA